MSEGNMSSLRYRLQGGPIQETSQEELTKLAQKNQMAAPPVVPQEAAVIGGNPDQAKMAGTPNQLRNAIQLGSQQTQAQAQSLYQGPRQQTQQEAAKVEQAGQLSGLSSLSQRVQSAVQKALPTTQNVQQPSTQTTDLTAQLGALSDADTTNDTGAITAIQKAWSDKTGKPVSEMRNEDLSAVVDAAKAGLDTQAVLDKAIQDRQQKDIQVKNLNLTDMGYADINQLSNDLSVPVANLEQMTVEQLIQTITEKQATGFSSSNQAQIQMSNLESMSPAERAAAGQTLREQGQTGVIAAENTVDRVAQDIQGAEKVINPLTGLEMSIKDALSDEQVSNQVEEFLRDPTSEASKRLQEQSPGLVEWVKKNQDVLKSASQSLTTAGTNAQTALTEAAKKYADVDPTLMSSLGFDPSKFGATPPPVIQLMKDASLSPDAQKSVASFAQELAATAPDVLKGMSASDLRKLGAQDSSVTSKQFIKLARDKQVASQMNPADPNSAIKFLGMQDMTPDRLNQMLGEAKNLERGGIALPPNLRKLSQMMVDLNWDGQIPVKLDKVASTWSNKINEQALSADSFTPGPYLNIGEDLGVQGIEQELAGRSDTDKALSLGYSDDDMIDAGDWHRIEATSLSPEVLDTLATEHYDKMDTQAQEGFKQTYKEQVAGPAFRQFLPPEYDINQDKEYSVETMLAARTALQENRASLSRIQREIVDAELSSLNQKLSAFDSSIQGNENAWGEAADQYDTTSSSKKGIDLSPSSVSQTVAETVFPKKTLRRWLGR